MQDAPIAEKFTNARESKLAVLRKHMAKCASTRRKRVYEERLEKESSRK
jgi:hypothetical protein